MEKQQEKLKLNKLSEKKHQVVFDVAKKLGGEVTTSDIYANSNLTIEEIEVILAELNAKNYVKSSLNEKSSVIRYLFPDIKREYLAEKRTMAEKLGIDKIVLRYKYRNFSQKPYADLEKCILQVAQDFQGRLSMARIIEYTGLSLNDAEAILSSLCAKGLCEKKFGENFESAEYFFPELIDTAYDKKIIQPDNLPQKFISGFKKNTDKFLIKGKVKKYHRKAKNKLFLDTIAPGTGHLADKRWNVAEFVLYSMLPFFLTAGLSHIPAMYITRLQTFKHYVISETEYLKKAGKINRNSLVYGLILLFTYIQVIGLDGMLTYYSYLLSLIGIG